MMQNDNIVLGNRSREIEVIGKFFSNENSAIKIIQNGVDLACFSDPKLIRIFTTTYDYFLSNKSLPSRNELVVTLGDEYRSDINRCSSVASKCSDSTLDVRIEELKEYRMSRRIKDVLTDVYNEMSAGVFGFDLFNVFVGRFNDIVKEDRGIDIYDIETAYDKVIPVLKDRMKGNIKEIQPSFIPSLDRCINGFPKGMSLVAGRPGMGKSMFMQNIAVLYAVQNSIPCMIFSAEMPVEDYVERIICSITGVRYTNLLSGELTDEEFSYIEKIKEVLSISPLYFVYSPSLTTNDIEIYIRIYKKVYGVEIFFIDYLQLLHPVSHSTTHYDYATIVDDIRRVSKSEDIFVVSAAQLNRDVDGRRDKRPMLSDVRDTDRAAMDCELVLGLYDDEYYNRDTERKGLLEVIVLKGRKTKLGMALLSKKSEICLIEEIEGVEY